jgi:hypothetical protein
VEDRVVVVVAVVERATLTKVALEHADTAGFGK